MTNSRVRIYILQSTVLGALVYSACSLLTPTWLLCLRVLWHAFVAACTMTNHRVRDHSNLLPQLPLGRTAQSNCTLLSSPTSSACVATSCDMCCCGCSAVRACGLACAAVGAVRAWVATSCDMCCCGRSACVRAACFVGPKKIKKGCGRPLLMLDNLLLPLPFPASSSYV